jgi:hypothetical protein
MPTTLQFRRYDTSTSANTTGANGELTVDSTRRTVVVHDGSTAGGISLGFLNVPQSGSDKSTSYTLTLNDIGRFIGVTSNGSITVPNSVFTNGDVISLYNNSSGNIVMTMQTANAFVTGNNTNRTTINISTRGIATVLYTNSNACIVTGSVV